MVVLAGVQVVEVVVVLADVWVIVLADVQVVELIVVEVV